MTTKTNQKKEIAQVSAPLDEIATIRQEIADAATVEALTAAVIHVGEMDETVTRTLQQETARVNIVLKGAMVRQYGAIVESDENVQDLCKSFREATGSGYSPESLRKFVRYYDALISLGDDFFGLWSAWEPIALASSSDPALYEAKQSGTCYEKVSADHFGRWLVLRKDGKVDAAGVVYTKPLVNAEGERNADNVTATAASQARKRREATAQKEAKDRADKIVREAHADGATMPGTRVKVSTFAKVSTDDLRAAVVILSGLIAEREEADDSK